MSRKVRVRFAPSPTGGLHLGGVRTALYNYLFARQHDGDFIVRIEDTDQSRFVAGAEEYIFACLRWCGLEPDESPADGGKYGPYRQSERKAIYRGYAEQLVEAGHAYYAFDTPEELAEMRHRHQTPDNPSPQYDYRTRTSMKNALTLPGHEVKQLLDAGTPHVVRIRMPEDERISFTDMIRGSMQFESNISDDKVLLKADGMPTYHLAVVVDDHLMQITHVFRGEEWLPSAPVHILLWKYLGWEDHMPQWAHMPLILGPNGKLSKRDGSRYGFPVFAMTWTDPNTNERVEGFRERGFLPEAFINFLALLGWNDGTDREIFSKADLIKHFGMERVHSGGAKFDFEKAKWFNHEWIRQMDAQALHAPVKAVMEKNDITVDDNRYLDQVIQLVKDRCTLLDDFVAQAGFFFGYPDTVDLSQIKPKWTDEKTQFFMQLIPLYRALSDWKAAHIEEHFKQLAVQSNIKPGELQLPLRIMLVGGKYGPPVFDIAQLLGKEETIRRIENVLREITA